MKVVETFSVLILLTIFLGCEDSLTPIIPSVLMETSFEEGTEPSLNGWRDEYPIYGYHKAKYSFSSDTPQNGGQWALKTMPPDSTFTVLRYSVNLEEINNYKNFSLSFWSKTNLHSGDFSISFITYSGNHSWVEPAVCDSSDWKYNTFNYSSNNSSIDRIVISVAMYANDDTSKFVLFDNFKLVEY